MKLTNVVFSFLKMGMRSKKKLMVQDIDKLNIGDFSDSIMPTIGDFNLYGLTSPHGLFDPNTWDVVEWNTANVAYWYESGSFIDLSFNESVCLYSRSGAWLESQMVPLDVFKVNGETLTYVLQTTRGLFREFNLLCELDAGHYRFMYANGRRIDSAWVILPKYV